LPARSEKNHENKKSGVAQPIVGRSADVGIVNDRRCYAFEMATRETQGTMLGIGGALAGPVTAYVYDWNILPIGQLLWLKELMSYKEFPPLRHRKPTIWTGS
jgi:hypothetical protein